MPRTNETAFNLALADVLRRKHPRWQARVGAEQTGVLEQRALRPDIVIRHPGGLPVTLETEFEPARSVEDDAVERLAHSVVGDAGIEHSIALKVPLSLRGSQAQLAGRIESTVFRYCVFFATEGEEPRRWPRTGWIGGNPDDLAGLIERVSESERLIARGMRVLEERIGWAAFKVLDDADLGFDGPLLQMADLLHQKPGKQTARMAMAIVANAVVFHNSIAASHQLQRIDQIRGLLGKISPTKVWASWQHILREINYWPIFDLASRILASLRPASAPAVIRQLSEAADELADVGVTSLHDMSGRMFQRLIVDRKFLATFYTLPSSAALLGELAVSRLRCDWREPASIAKLRIADLACGTGTLISAAYQAVLGRHRRTGGQDADLHGPMMERALIAADIMPAATHLAASILSSAHPGLTFSRTRVLTMPYGRQEPGRPLALGSLDLIEKEVARPLFGTGRQVAHGRRPHEDAEEADDEVVLDHSSADLVIMNPPFTRPTNHESTTVPVPSFAGFEKSRDEQKAMSGHLKKVRGQLEQPAGHGNAGLASNFVDLAHVKTKPGGELALVLPASSVSGHSWTGMRGLLAAQYRDLCVVSIATSGSTDRAFSADTGMAEVLVLARKCKGPGEADGETLFVNLSARPGSLAEAAETARAIANLPSASRSGKLRIGDTQRAGNFLRAPLSEGGCAGLLEERLALSMMTFRRGVLRLPRSNDAEIPVTTLARLGARGLVHRDISGTERGARTGMPRGPFDVVPMGRTPLAAVSYPMLWAHRASQERRLVVAPDHQGEVRDGCEARAVEVWNGTASRLHCNLGFQLNSQSLAACLTEEPSIGGRAWPNFLLLRPELAEVVVLCANTTLGLMGFWWVGTRQQEGRAGMTITKLPELPILDPTVLGTGAIAKAKREFESLRKREFLPANEAYRDSAREALDRFVLVNLFGLPEAVLGPLALLRNQWCAEPSVHGGKNTRLR
ncbi:MAG: hypothetical protein OXN89_15595 [Bryobacterales bacterium]|nr:hypothetical protein [Bryobacterales bacterium]